MTSSNNKGFGEEYQSSKTSIYQSIPLLNIGYCCATGSMLAARSTQRSSKYKLTLGVSHTEMVNEATGISKVTYRKCVENKEGGERTPLTGKTVVQEEN